MRTLIAIIYLYAHKKSRSILKEIDLCRYMYRYTEDDKQHITLTISRENQDQYEKNKSNIMMSKLDVRAWTCSFVSTTPEDKIADVYFSNIKKFGIMSVHACDPQTYRSFLRPGISPNYMLITSDNPCPSHSSIPDIVMDIAPYGNYFYVLSFENYANILKAKLIFPTLSITSVFFSTDLFDVEE